jgi:arginyl-tRNA synthetase
MDRAIKICEEKGLTCEDRGALLVDLVKYKMDKAIIRKADGTSIYLTRDLGGAFDKWNKYKFDKHIYVVQAAQGLHFRQLYKTLELMEEEYAGRFEHVSFGESVHPSAPLTQVSSLACRLAEVQSNSSMISWTKRPK